MKNLAVAQMSLATYKFGDPEKQDHNLKNFLGDMPPITESGQIEQELFQLIQRTLR